jgi:hypothetical protein
LRKRPAIEEDKLIVIITGAFGKQFDDELSDNYRLFGNGRIIYTRLARLAPPPAVAVIGGTAEFVGEFLSPRARGECLPDAVPACCMHWRGRTAPPDF